MIKTTQAAIEYLRVKLQGSAHLAAGMPSSNCQLCDALDHLYRTAEMGEALKLAAECGDQIGCRGCPLWEACNKAPKDCGRCGLLMCQHPIKYLDLWLEAARKEGKR